MKFPLGAMTVGDILDRGLKLLFGRLPVFYAINLIVLTPVIVVQVLAPLLFDQGNRLNQSAMMGAAGVGFLALLLTLVLQPIGAAAILHIVMEEYVGRRPTVGQALSFALTRFLPLVGASILVGLIIMVGLMLCCVPGIYFAITYAFVGQVVVLERLGAGDSLRRSQELVTGFRWRVFGVLLLVGAANMIAQVAIGAGLGAVLPTHEVVPAGDGVRVQVNAVNHVIDTLVTQLVNILFSSYVTVCTTLLYLDLRIRKEGFDLELAALQGEAGMPGDEYDRYQGDDRDNPFRDDQR